MASCDEWLCEGPELARCFASVEFAINAATTLPVLSSLANVVVTKTARD
jgi:hypothetical protein